MKRTVWIPAYLALFFILVLTPMMGRKNGYTVDANAPFAITQGIVERGEFFPETAVKQGYVYSIVYIPFYAAGGMLQPLFPELDRDFLQRKAMCWMNTLFTAVTLSVLSLLVRALGYSPKSQILIPLIYGFTTLALPYARYDYNKCLATLLLLSSFYFFVQFFLANKRNALWWSGGVLGFLLLVRLEMGVVLPAYVWLLYRRDGMQRKQYIHLIVPVATSVLLIVAYNLYYWSGSAAGGYEGSFNGNPLTALYGFLFSPGKSILILNPVLLLMPLTLRFFKQRNSSIFILWCAVVLPLLLVYCLWGNWWGGWGFGPRHLVPLLPLLVLPLAECVDQPRSLLYPFLIVLACVGGVIQWMGSAIDFNDVIYTLMNNGVTEDQLIWNPYCNPVLQHYTFLAYLPESRWDFAFIPFILTASLTALLLTATLWCAAMGWCIYQFSRYVKDNKEETPVEQ